MPAFTKQRLTLPTGVELDVLQSGDKAGAPLLLLHGFTDSARSMQPLMVHLPPGVRAIAVTQRGHGDSSKPRSYGFSDCAADAAAVLDALEAPRAIVFGHSMGSLVALRFALAYPERTAGLILEGAAPGFVGNQALQNFYDHSVWRLEDPIDPDFAREFQMSAVGRPPPPAFLDMAVAETCKLPAAGWRALCEAMLAEDLTPALDQIQARVLLLWGELDSIVGQADQDRLLAGLRHSELKAFPDLGHSPHWEDPRRIAALLGPFILRHGARARALEVVQ